jgi:large subunit ribosomal protein L22
MGARKRNTAETIAESRKTESMAKLINCPTSPRKMRLVADMIRGVEVNKALQILKYNPKEASGRLEKLLLSAINNWEQKNEEKSLDTSNLIVRDIYVDSARMLKRIQPAPQGRAHRIRKRSNHVTIIVDSKPSEDK